MLYPTELSSGDVPGSNRCIGASAVPDLSATVIRNTPSHASAYATAAPRAPDGTGARTAENVFEDVPHCRLSPTGNPCGASRHALFHPGAARVGASPRSAHAPVAAAPLPRGAHARYPDAPGRKPRVSLSDETKPVRCTCILRERQKQNAPGTCDPRAFACLGRSGWPISQGGQPRLGVQIPLAFETARQDARARAVAWPQGNQVRVGGKADHGNRFGEKTATRAKAAHDTPVVFKLQHFFNVDPVEPMRGVITTSTGRAEGGMGTVRIAAFVSSL